MRAVLVLAALLALPAVDALVPRPSALALGAGPEFTILDAFLSPADDVAIQHTHCLREGGMYPPKDMMQFAEIPPTNAIMGMHIANHSRDDDGAQGGDVDRDDRDHYGVNFLAEHHMMIAEYDAWRVAHGARPVLSWDTNTRIPADFIYEPPTACQPRKTDDPRVPLPTWATLAGGTQKDPLFNYTSLCEFPSANRLGKSLGPYHDAVHGGIGGDMTNGVLSPRDPIFWAWHKWLDGVAVEWESCGHADDMQELLSNMTEMGVMQTPRSAAGGSSVHAVRAAPGSGPMTAGAAFVALALVLRKRLDVPK